MSVDFELCCGTTCDKAANKAHVEKLERDVARFRMLTKEYRTAMGGSDFERMLELDDEIDTLLGETEYALRANRSVHDLVGSRRVTVPCPQCGGDGFVFTRLPGRIGTRTCDCQTKEG